MLNRIHYSLFIIFFSFSYSIANEGMKYSLSIDKTNKMIRNSKKLNQILLPIRDGVMIFQKDINE